MFIYDHILADPEEDRFYNLNTGEEYRSVGNIVHNLFQLSEAVEHIELHKRAKRRTSYGYKKTEDEYSQEEELAIKIGRARNLYYKSIAKKLVENTPVYFKHCSKICPFLEEFNVHRYCRRFSEKYLMAKRKRAQIVVYSDELKIAGIVDVEMELENVSFLFHFIANLRGLKKIYKYGEYLAPHLGYFIPYCFLEKYKMHARILSYLYKKQFGKKGEITVVHCLHTTKEIIVPNIPNFEFFLKVIAL